MAPWTHCSTITSPRSSYAAAWLCAPTTNTAPAAIFWTLLAMASASALRTLARMGATTACRGVLARAAPRVIHTRHAASGVRHASVLTVDNPYTGGVAAEVELVDETRAFAQLTNAAVVQRSWRHVPLEDRIALCERFLEALKARQGDIAKEITAMMGKPLSQASGEVDGAIERAQGECAASLGRGTRAWYSNVCTCVITAVQASSTLPLLPWPRKCCLKSRASSARL